MRLLLTRGLLAVLPLLPAMVLGQDAGAPSPDAATSVARLDELWKTRDDPASIAGINDAIRMGVRSFPTDYQILWRASRFRWWEADGEAKEIRKRMVAKEGWNYANRALEARPDGAEGKYYLALSIGAYSQAVGVLNAIAEGLEGRFVDALDFAIAHQEDFDRAGGHTAKGRYYWELPWIKRDLKKSKAELEKSLALHPEHLRNYYYLAQTLQKDGDKAGARAALDKALTGPDTYDPPEARRVKAWASAIASEL
jgi:tetratricopeptide (TPR) repeat protein